MHSLLLGFITELRQGIFDEIPEAERQNRIAPLTIGTSVAVLFVFPAQRHISISILTLLDTLLSNELDLLEGWVIDLRLVGLDIITKLLRCSRTLASYACNGLVR
jgi:hypothetical protein